MITGVGGFIGFHVAKRLIKEGYRVLGIDNLNDYYDIKLKKDRLQQLQNTKFIFEQISLQNHEELINRLQMHEISIVIHLAAQAGVKYCSINPNAYIQSNLVGFSNMLEYAKRMNVKHFLYASSSSVYGANQKVPFSVKDSVDHPLTLYAATKRANELIAHSYSLNGLASTGMRFFNVYGPWGRPDMALFIFTKRILEEQPIYINNNGNMLRDFTYIDDVVECVVRLMKKVPKGCESRELTNPSQSYTPYQLFNIGNQKPIHLMDFISMIESKLGKKAIKRFLPVQPEEVFQTFADVNELQEAIQYSPSTPITHGIDQFLEWFFSYYKYDQHKELKKKIESR